MNEVGGSRRDSWPCRERGHHLLQIRAREPSPARHHTNGLLETRDIFERISVNEEQVRPLASRDSPELFLSAEEARRKNGRRAHHLVRRQATFTEQTELVMQ